MLSTHTYHVLISKTIVKRTFYLHIVLTGCFHLFLMTSVNINQVSDIELYVILV